MRQRMEAKEPIIIEGRIVVPYRYSVGGVGSKFLIALRDNKRIMAIRCRECNRVYMPPRGNCSRCFSKLEEWVELEGKGTLLTYTIINYPLPIHPVEAPFAYGVIQLDGADTGFTHLLGEVDPKEIRIGMRVEPVFREEREGNILDIKYFRPLSSES
ncbi:MAG: Zn-ribbon domain-containing OB-fold protein [Dehalococcoidia bacterium]